MNAQPPGPQRLSASDSHRARHIAESFGADVERYDRTRPRYPQSVVDAIIAASPGRQVLDVGIGTGVSTQPFRAAGCQVLGVDPDARMAGFARSRGFEVEVSTFEEWDAGGRTFDLVISGQTWHWVDPVVGATKSAEVLHPGGRLALFWNVFEVPPGLGDAFTAVYSRVIPEWPLFPSGGLAAYSGQLTKAADGIGEVGSFGDPEQWQFDWEHPYTREEWLDIVPTFGGHNRLSPGVLEELLEGLGAAIDAVGGRFTMLYNTVTVTAARTGAR